MRNCPSFINIVIILSALVRITGYEYTFLASKIGEMHTEAFHALSEMYRTKRPKNKMVMMNDIRDISYSLCGDEDESTCATHINGLKSHRKMWEANELNPGYDVVFPNDFNPTLLRYIDGIFTTLELLVSKETNSDLSDISGKVDVVLEVLCDIQKGMERFSIDLDDNNDSKDQPEVLHTMAALFGVSVAIESTKLWTQVYNDTTHPLYGLHHSSYYPSLIGNEHHNRGRRIQYVAGNSDDYVSIGYTSSRITSKNIAEGDTNIFTESDCFDVFGFVGNSNSSVDKTPCAEFLIDQFDPVGTIEADVTGVINGVLELLVTQPTNILNPATLFALSFFSAVASSANWALNPPSAAPSFSLTTA